MNSAISVVIPVRNGALHVAEAIESVLAQTMRAREVLVIDDGSEDLTGEVVRRFGPPVVLLKQPWRGTAAAANLGVAHATSDLVAFLDHDDVWSPEKLALQTAELGRQPELDAVFGAIQQFISPEVGEALRARLRCPTQPQPGLATSTVLLRREALLRYGEFRGGQNAISFMPWFVRAKDRGLRYAVLQDVVARRRLHAGNSGLRQRDVNRQQYLDVSREMILARRAARTLSKSPDTGIVEV